MGESSRTEEAVLQGASEAVERQETRRSKKGREEDSGRQVGDLREGEGHQSTTNHYKVKDVPQVPEIRTLVQDQPQIHHLKEEERTRL